MHNAVLKLKTFCSDGRNVMTMGLMLLLVSCILSPGIAHADTMPWDTFAQKIACSVSGPWVKWLAVLAVALGGIMFGLGELSGPFQRMMQIAGGFSIAVGATAVVPWMLGGNNATGACSTASLYIETLTRFI